jgi:DNA repair exonuclease SbcCD ATPase subunit
MLVFKKLRYKNFLSVGDTEIEIDLDGTRSTLIVGHNGSGKSLMLDALSFVLFGKPHRAINKPQLVNSINGKGMRVEIEFENGPSEYKIIRGLKPNIFEIWVNGTMINQESHARDYQKLLETNILKLNHKSFHQVVVLGSSNFVPFMQLSAYHRREVIEDLLDIMIFSRMNGVLKESTAKLKDTIKDTEYQYSLVNEKIVMQRKYIDSLKSIGETNAAKYDDEIIHLREQIDSLLQKNEEMLFEYNAAYESTRSTLKSTEQTRSKLKGYEHQINDNIKKIVVESKFYEHHVECPTCSQTIDETVRNSKLEDCRCRAKELSDGRDQLLKSMKDVETKFVEYESKLSSLLKLNNQVSGNNIVIGNYERRIRDLEGLKTKECNHDDLRKAEDDLDVINDNRDLLSNLKSAQLEDRTYNEVIAELLKDTGIKTKIIRQYLPVMNKLINHYLQILDFFVSFELDENFSETIRSRYRDDFSYASFSEGEKSRIDLSIMFAWRQISKLKNSSNTNLLILDEVFDSSLDTDGVDNLLKIMSSLDEDTRLYVITHKPESFEPLFDRKITASRRGNFTTYTEELLKD